MHCYIRWDPFSLIYFSILSPFPGRWLTGTVSRGAETKPRCPPRRGTWDSQGTAGRQNISCHAHAFPLWRYFPPRVNDLCKSLKQGKIKFLLRCALLGQIIPSCPRCSAYVGPAARGSVWPCVVEEGSLCSYGKGKNQIWAQRDWSKWSWQIPLQTGRSNAVGLALCGAACMALWC